MTEHASLAEYRRFLNVLADQDSDELAPSGTTPFAAILLETIISHAKDHVQIFTGKLNDAVYGASNVVDALGPFLRHGRLKVLMEEQPDDLQRHPLVSICKSNPTACDFRTLNTPLQQAPQSHFVVADGKAWRFEPDKNMPAAVGCFNDTDIGTKLENSFQVMFDRGEQVLLDVTGPEH